MCRTPARSRHAEIPFRPRPTREPGAHDATHASRRRSSAGRTLSMTAAAPGQALLLGCAVQGEMRKLEVLYAADSTASVPDALRTVKRAARATAMAQALRRALLA